MAASCIRSLNKNQTFFGVTAPNLFNNERFTVKGKFLPFTDKEKGYYGNGIEGI